MITSKDMKELEKTAEECGVTQAELMENAGRQVVDAIEDEFKDKIKLKKILVICGQGNNGGDGFVIARYLKDVCDVKVLFLGEESMLSPEASANYDYLKDIDKEMVKKYDQDTAPFINFMNYDIIVDAMLGTGAKGELRYPYSLVVKNVSYAKAFVVSVDIPTGINPDKNKDHGEVYLDADMIVTFHDTKPGLEEFEDKVKIVDIGIPF